MHHEHLIFHWHRQVEYPVSEIDHELGRGLQLCPLPVGAQLMKITNALPSVIIKIAEFCYNPSRRGTGKNIDTYHVIS